MLGSSLDESGVGESQCFPRTALVTRAARVKISLIWCFLFIEAGNQNEVKERRRQKIPESLVDLNLIFFLVHIVVCFPISASF